MIEEFNGIAIEAERLFRAGMPNLVHYNEIRRMGNLGIEQFYVDSATFGIDEYDITKHWHALLDQLPKMIGSLRAFLDIRKAEKVYTLELPPLDEVADGRYAGPIRMISIRHDGSFRWLTRFDVIFESVGAA